jgi:polyisoprenoid-binding protein YceI
MSSSVMKKVALALGGVAVIAVVVFVGLNLWLSSDDAPELFEPSATLDAESPGDNPDAASVDDPLAPPTGEWVVELAAGDDNGVGYRIIEDLPIGGPEEVAGRTEMVAGGLTLDAERLAATDIVVQMDTLSSGNDLRDSIVGAQYLEVGAHPTAEFVLDEPSAIAVPEQPGLLEPFTASGTLTIHGQAQTVTVSGDAQWTPGTIEIVGTTDITLDQFGIEQPDLVGRRARNEATIEFKLRFVPAPAAG